MRPLVGLEGGWMARPFAPLSALKKSWAAKMRSPSTELF